MKRGHPRKKRGVVSLSKRAAKNLQFPLILSSYKVATIGEGQVARHKDLTFGGYIRAVVTLAGNHHSLQEFIILSL